MASTAMLVVHQAMSRPEALAIVALAVHSRVVGVGTLESHVPLPSGARAYVEIPRFGDPPPFAIDVVDDGPDARTAALELLIALRQTTPWRIRPDFDED